MKNVLFLLLLSLAVASCKVSEPKDYVTIKGLIANNGTNNIDIVSRGFKKSIRVNSNGTFSDTIKLVQSGYHTFNDGKNKTLIHIKNDDVLEMNYDYTDFNKTVKFSGKGFETSHYLNERKRIDDEENIRDAKAFFKLKPSEFTTKINRIEKGLKTILNANGIDSTLKKAEENRNAKFIEYLKRSYAKEHTLQSKFKTGNDAPKFVNYENYNGGKTSLDDLKGNLVYIDVWATWCGPCKREIPYLQKLENEFKGKKIKFVSISVDNGRGYNNNPDKAKIGWKKMIKDKNMGGIQLYADKAWSSDFIKSFGVRSIPRFILLDKEGKIINANAPRPSSNQIKNLIKTSLK